MFIMCTLAGAKWIERYMANESAICAEKTQMESQLHRYFQINYITSIDGVDDLCQNIRTKLTYLEPKPIRHNQSQKTSAFDA